MARWSARHARTLCASTCLCLALAFTTVSRGWTADESVRGEGATARSRESRRLYVSRSPEGRWIAWTEADGKRTGVEIPQKPEELTRFADDRRYTLIWHAEQTTQAQARDAALTPNSERRPDGIKAVSDAAVRPASAEQAADDPAIGSPDPSSTGQPARQPAEAAPAPMDVAPLSPAEQITRLQRTMEADQRRRDEIQSALNDPMGEYHRAEAGFQDLDRTLQEQKALVQKLRDEQRSTEAVEADARLIEMQGKWKLARERFDLAIHSRQVQQEKLVSLDDKLRQNREALNRLTARPQPAADRAPAPLPETTGWAGGTPAASASAVASESDAAATAGTGPVSPAGAAADPGDGGTAAMATAGNPAAAPSTPPPSAEPQPPAELPAANPPPVAANAASDTTPAAAAPAEQAAPSRELVEARHDAETKGAAAREAEQEAVSLGERVQVLDRNIELQQRLLENARRRRDNANQSRIQLEEEHLRRSQEGIAPAELRALVEQVDEAERRYSEASDEVREGAQQLDAMQSERAALQAEALAALTQAADKRRLANQADQRVQEIQNPFTVRNVLQWSLDHGPRLLLIVLGMFLLKLVMRAGSRRLVNVMARGGVRGTREEREDRARTLVGVFHSAGSVAIIVGGTLMICDEIGIAVAPLMGGAAVLGLAVAFGAQNLIRDYFYGFVILLENQYKINDVVKIGETAGQVERITLRCTVLRDLEGRVHFVPNGRIDAVTNMTHGWSRALFEVGVAYKEDPDRVMAVLLELARELRSDPAFGPLILDNAEMLGLDSFGDSSINIKFFIKTRPLKQWTVKRELLRRIKRRFDELGIEIPFPHRTVYHRRQDEAAARDPWNDGEIQREAA